MFLKNKHGSIGFIVMLCIAITVASSVMLLLLSTSYSNIRVIEKAASKTAKYTSKSDIAAEWFIGVIDNKELRQGSSALTLSDITYIKEQTNALLQDDALEITADNVLIDDIASSRQLSIKLNNGYKITISNLDITTRQEENIVGYSEDEQPIIEYITYYTIHSINSEVHIEKEGETS